MYGKLHKFIFFFISLQFLIPAYGQSMQFRNISVKDGLSHSYVLSFLQDSEGLMWVGTFDGLNLYTGYSLIHYSVNSEDTNSISNNCIYSIIEDSKGIIWLGTENGLNKFDKTTGNFKSYLHNPKNNKSLSHNHIRGLYEDKDQNIWVITYGGGLCKFDQTTEEFTRYQVNGDRKGLLSNKINTLFVNSSELFWLGTEEGGISVFDPKTEHFIDQYYKTGNNKTINDNTVNTIYEDLKGNYWIGTWYGGLNYYNPHTNQWIYYKHSKDNPNSLPSNTVRDIKYDKNNHLWIATFGGGLCRFNMNNHETKQNTINLNHQPNIAQKNLWTLYKDNKNNLWIGSFGDGIYIRNHLKETFPYKYIKTSKDEILGISALAEDYQNTVWIGTMNGTLYTYNEEENKITPFNNKLKFQQSINTIYEDKLGRLWLGTNNGLYRISKNRKEILYYKPSTGSDHLDKNAIISIYEDYKGDLWLGMWGIGINLITAEEIKKNDPTNTKVKKYLYNPEDSTSISHHIVWDFFEDAQKNLWICTSNVLNRFDRYSNSFINYDNIKTVSSIIEDESGVLWASSLSNGLYKIEKNGEVITNVTNNLFSEKIKVDNLLQDQFGNFWMSSKNKLYRYNPLSKNINIYSSEYGLQDDNFLINVSLKLKSGTLLFGGMKGFNIFRPENIPTEKESQNIIITDFKVFNQSIVKEISKNPQSPIQTPIYSTDSIALDYTQNVFSIEFSVLDYFTSSNIRYSYKLDGFNKDWILTDSKNRIATYTNLKGGEYTFQVRATDVLGNWTGEIKRLKIFIKPPIWQKLGFKITLLLLLIMIIAVLFRIRINQLKLKYKRNQEHNRVVNLQKDIEGASLQINLLQEEIERKNKKNASLALRQVAYNERIDTLIKDITQLKDKTKNISLQQELNLLVNSINKDFKSLGSKEAFKDNVNLLYDNFIERLAKKHLKLTHKDLKICSFIRMNKTNREIAEILNISKSSVEISRYRIRKKLDLPLGTNLNDYLLRF